MIRRTDKVKVQQLVEVVFDDPAEFDSNYDIEHNQVECRAVGWLVTNDSSLVRISWLKESDDTPYVGLAIPKGCVKKLKALEKRKNLLNLRLEKK